MLCLQLVFANTKICSSVPAEHICFPVLQGSSTKSNRLNSKLRDEFWCLTTSTRKNRCEYRICNDEIFEINIPCFTISRRNSTKVPIFWQFADLTDCQNDPAFFTFEVGQGKLVKKQISGWTACIKVITK